MRTVTKLAADWFERFAVEIFDLFGREMTWGDAVLLHAAEEYGVAAIITWNKKHFEDRTIIPVLTPGQYLEETARSST